VERVRKEKSVCFFLVTSNENPRLSARLKDIYLKVAEDRVIQSYFYQIDQDTLPENVHVETPTIVVSKDDSIVAFQGMQG